MTTARRRRKKTLKKWRTRLIVKWREILPLSTSNYSATGRMMWWDHLGIRLLVFSCSHHRISCALCLFGQFVALDFARSFSGHRFLFLSVAVLVNMLTKRLRNGWNPSQGETAQGHPFTDSTNPISCRPQTKIDVCHAGQVRVSPLRTTSQLARQGVRGTSWEVKRVQGCGSGRLCPFRVKVSSCVIRMPIPWPLSFSTVNPPIVYGRAGTEDPGRCVRLTAFMF